MKKLYYLEGLRGYMSLWVFFTHALTMATFPFEKEEGIGKLVVNGYWPVCIFIILSGFVTHILLEKKEPYKWFMFRRAFRLFPVYLFCLILSLFAMPYYQEILQSIPWENSKNIMRIEQVDAAFNNHFSLNAISHFLLLHGLLPEKIIPAAYTIMGQAWSLTLEWQFYLVIPLFYLLVNGKLNKITSILVMLITAFLILWSKSYMPQKSFLPNLLHLFALGYFTYQFYKIELQQNKKNYTIKFLSVFLFFLLFFDINLALITLLWMATIYFQINPNKVSDLIFQNKIILYIGKISYSLYCIHILILALSVYIVLNIAQVENQNIFRFAVLGLSLPLSLFVSHLTYTYIEVPFINFAKKK